MGERKSFLLYTDTAAVFKALTDEQAGQVIKHIFDYAEDGDDEIDPLDPALQAIFLMFKAQIDRDAAKWEITRARRTEAGRLGGLAKASNAKQNLAKASNAKQDVANLAVSVSDSVSVSVSNKDNKRFKRPTDEEVYAYFVSQGWPYNEAGAFYDYYESNGWRVGRNPMKDWQAAARNWMKRARPAGTGGKQSASSQIINLLESGVLQG